MPLRLRMSEASFASPRVTECRDVAGSWSRAKLQKPQRALQALVMAKWHRPGPPSQMVCSAILQIEVRLGALLFPMSSPPAQLSRACFLSDL
jgi:hypothetical protein